MPNLTEFGTRIKQKRLELNMTQDELARKVGYTSRSSINKIELGFVDLPQSKIAAIANALGTTPAYLMGWDSEKNTATSPFVGFSNISPVSTQRIPMLGEIACGRPLLCNEDHESYIETNSAIKADFCLRCKGDSMTGARIYDGDIVFVHRQEIVENGQIAAVAIGNEATLKRVFYYPEKSKLVLQAENPKYEPLVFVNEELNEVHILGLAIMFQSTVR